MLNTPVALPDATPGGEFRVVKVESDCEDADRLRTLGICLGRRLKIVQSGDPLIVFVVGSRVGMSARLAKTVIVEMATDVVGGE